ncbi:inositol monophosphatase family protein [Ectopseudomonas mendocina]
MTCAYLLKPVTEIVLSAGKLLSAEWERPEGPRGQGGKAEVDVEIESILRTDLLALLDCDFWGEETGTHLSGHEYCWVVDPNDGTTDFLLGRKGSAISVGLLHNSIPVLGVVYAPVTADRGPDCISWAEGCSNVIRNGQEVLPHLEHAGLAPGSHVLVSTAAVSKPELNAELCAPADFIPMPSIAYRLARVAAGDALACASLVPVSAHDVVGGHALLIGGQGVLLNQDGNPVTYDTLAMMTQASARCFGGALGACRELAQRDWGRLFWDNIETGSH